VSIALHWRAGGADGLSEIDRSEASVITADARQTDADREAEREPFAYDRSAEPEAATIVQATPQVVALAPALSPSSPGLPALESPADGGAAVVPPALQSSTGSAAAAAAAPGAPARETATVVPPALVTAAPVAAIAAPPPVPVPHFELALPPTLLAPARLSMSLGPGRRQGYDATRARSEARSLASSLGTTGAVLAVTMRSTAKARKDELTAMAATVRQAIVADIRGTAALIAGEVQSARAAAAESETRHGSEVAAAIEAGPARLAGVTRAGIEALDDAARTRTKQAEDAVTDAKTRARELGKSEGQRGKDAIDAQAAEARRRGQDKAAAYTADERGDVQRAAVLKVAAETVAKLAEPGPELLSNLIESGEDLSEGFDGAEEAVIETIASQAESVRGAFTAQGEALTPHLNRVAAQAMAGMADAGGRAAAGLTAVEAAASSQLAMLETILTAQLDLAITSTLQVIDVQTEAVISAVESLITRTVNAVLRLDQPAPERVKATVTATESMALAASDDFIEGLDEMAGFLEGTFADGQAAVMEHTAGIASGVSDGLADTVDKTDEGFAVVASKAPVGIDLIAKEWGAALADAKTNTDSEYGKAVEGLRTDVGRTLEKGRVGLVSKVDEAVRKNREGLDALESNMEKAAKEAREKYDAPWYEKVGSWLWNALLGLLKALAIALAVIVVAVVAIVLIVVGIIEGAVALLIIGLVLLAAVVVFAVYGIVAGIVARVRSADTWYGGIWGGVVGVLDIVGVPNVIEGIIRRDIVNGRRLTIEESGERFGGGLFNAVTFFLPMKFAKARGVPKVPREPVTPTLPRTPELPRLGEAPEVPVEVAKAPEVPVEVAKAPEVPVEVAKAPEVPVEVAKAPEVPAEVAKAPEVPAEAEPKPPAEPEAKPAEPAAEPEAKPAEPAAPLESGAPKPDSPEAVTTELPEKLPPKPEPGAPGSPEHKAARWASYQQRTGGKGWSYKRWSNVYERNMLQAKRAHAAVDAFHKILGWGEREVTVMVEGEARRLDIADKATLRGVEHKTGRQSASKLNRWEIVRDEILVKKLGWKIEWVFEGTASANLLAELKAAGITWRFVKPTVGGP
jgi:hypothetical protein